MGTCAALIFWVAYILVCVISGTCKSCAAMVNIVRINITLYIILVYKILENTIEAGVENCISLWNMRNIVCNIIVIIYSTIYGCAHDVRADEITKNLTDEAIQIPRRRVSKRQVIVVSGNAINLINNKIYTRLH